MNLIYQYGFFILLGIVIGVVITVKWLAPPEGDVHFGKLKIRGKGHTVSDIMDIEAPEKKERVRRKDRK